MERLYKIKTLMIMALCILTLGACSSDDEPEYTPSAPDYLVFTLNMAARGTDQSDIVATSVSYTNTQGKIVEVAMTDDVQTIKGAPDKGFPGKINITIHQSLKSGANLNKDSYNLGLTTELIVTSVNKEGQVIASENLGASDVTEVAGNQLSNYLPITNSYTITVDTNGQFEITK